jgi:sec-independent protein translocase protein TatA
MGAFRLGPTELIIILVIVLLLFGPGRIAKIAGELGRGVRSFKDGINPDSSDGETEETVEKKKDES